MFQVWGIDYDDRQIFFRTGVTSDEQTGRSWVHIDLPFTSFGGGVGGRSRHNSARSDVSGTSSNITLSSAPSCKSIASVGAKSDSSSKSNATMKSNYSFPESPVVTGEYTEGGTLKAHKSTVDLNKTGNTSDDADPLKAQKSAIDLTVHTKPDPNSHILQAKKSKCDANNCQNIASVWTGEDYDPNIDLSTDGQVRPKSCGEFSTPRKPSHESSDSLQSQEDYQVCVNSPSAARKSAMITSISSSDFKVSFRNYTECVEVGLSSSDKYEDDEGEMLRSESGGIVSHQYEDEDEDEDLWDDNLLENADIHWVWVSPFACNILGQTDIKRWIMPQSGQSKFCLH